MTEEIVDEVVPQSSEGEVLVSELGPRRVRIGHIRDRKSDETYLAVTVSSWNGLLETEPVRVHLGDLLDAIKAFDRSETMTEICLQEVPEDHSCR